MTAQKLGRTDELGAKLVFAALQILKEKGSEAPAGEVAAGVENRVPLDDWARRTYEKSGGVQWRISLGFYTMSCVKPGYLIKRKGVWYLTPEGDKAMQLGEAGLFAELMSPRRKQERLPPESDGPEEIEEGPQVQEARIEDIQQEAVKGLKEQIGLKNPYEFQRLVAALLRGMGYYTPFVAPKGKDGGVDVIAYRDPLGTVSPRIKVQVKHRDSPASGPEVQQLMGLLQKEGDVGIFVSSGGFTADAKAAARSSHVHVELIDLDRLISLWQDFYAKLTDEDKTLLPLMPIYFYAPPV